jgi:hypothetical protein
MSKSIISSVWNNSCGTKNTKNYSKSSAFGNIPINNSYMYFKNGSYKKSLNGDLIPPELKESIDKESKRVEATRYGPLSLRPLSFSEQQFSDYYYNSEDFNFLAGSIPIGFLDVFIVALFFGIPTGNMMGLLIAMQVKLMLEAAFFSSFYSFVGAKIPKIGTSRMYAYKRDGEMINRNNLAADGVNLFKKKIINLSTFDEFIKNLGQADLDSAMSKSELLGGSGFSTDIIRKSFDTKGSDAANFIKYINNLKANLNKKYSTNMNKWSIKPTATYKSNEENLLESMKKNYLTGVGIGWSAKSSLSIDIDFTDYIVAKRDLGLSFLTRPLRKDLANPSKEKSIFGPYICRSRSSWLIYPRIYISCPSWSTWKPLNIMGNEYKGGLYLFGGVVPVVNLGEFPFKMLVILLASAGVFFPLAIGTGGYSSEALTLPVSPPKNFPLG